MNKLGAIGFFILVCFGSACSNQADSQSDLTKGKHVDYLFDPVSETCAVVKYPRTKHAIAWQVPCTPAVIAKLDPSVREQARVVAVRSLSAESPH